jgi:hypothetical protein
MQNPDVKKTIKPNQLQPILARHFSTSKISRLSSSNSSKNHPKRPTTYQIRIKLLEPSKPNLIVGRYTLLKYAYHKGKKAVALPWTHSSLIIPNIGRKDPILFGEGRFTCPCRHLKMLCLLSYAG